MRAVIIGNGDISDYDYIRSKIIDGDYIICADGGLRHLKDLEIMADLAIGDFDSSEIRDDIECITYPRDKDFTDGEIALDYAMEKGFDEIIMIGMTSSRLDHTITNILLATRGSRVWVIDEKNEICSVTDKLVIEGKKGKTLSIIPVFGNLTGVSLKGFKYELINDILFLGSSRGNSNVIADDKCEITVKDGMGIVIINDGE